MKGLSLLFVLALFVVAGSSVHYKYRYNPHSDSGMHRMDRQHRGNPDRYLMSGESTEQYNQQNTHWRKDDYSNNNNNDNWNNQRRKSSREQSINSLEEIKHGSKWTDFPSWSSSSSSEEQQDRRMNQNGQSQEFGGKKKYANWFYEFFGVSDENSSESQSQEGQDRYNNNNQQRGYNFRNQQYQHGNNYENNNNNQQYRWEKDEGKINNIQHKQRVVKNPKNSNEICVTINPVPMCPCQWNEQQSRQEYVPVVCKQKQELKNYNAVTLQKALQQGEIEIKWQQTPKMLRVPMAQKCVKSNRHSASTYSLSGSDELKF